MLDFDLFIKDLTEEEKIKYATCLGRVILNDQDIEMAETQYLYKIFAQMELDKVIRNRIISDISQKRIIGFKANFLNINVKFPLLKDAMMLFLYSSDRNEKTVNDLIRSLKINEQQLKAIQRWVDIEFAITEAIKTRAPIDRAAVKELPVLFAETGIPLGVLYFAGSGLSNIYRNALKE